MVPLFLFLGATLKPQPNWAESEAGGWLTFTFSCRIVASLRFRTSLGPRCAPGRYCGRRSLGVLSAKDGGRAKEKCGRRARRSECRREAVGRSTPPIYASHLRLHTRSCSPWANCVFLASALKIQLNGSQSDGGSCLVFALSRRIVAVFRFRTSLGPRCTPGRCCGPYSLRPLSAKDGGSGKGKMPYLVSRISYLVSRVTAGWRREAGGRWA